MGFLAGLRTERGHEAVVGLAFIAIPMVLFLVLQIFAIGYALVISFFDWGIRGAREFVGLANYLELLSDRVFLNKAIPNTLFLTAVVVPAQMALGPLARGDRQPEDPRSKFFRAAFFFPSIASSAAIVVLFTFLTQPEGLLNTDPRVRRDRVEHELDERPGHRPAIDHGAPHLDDVRDDDAVLPRCAAGDQSRAL